MTPPLRIEISRFARGEWRVVERSHHAAQNCIPVAYSEDELSALLTEIGAILQDANASSEANRVDLRRLGARLADLSIPVILREKMTSYPGAIEFFLDDAAMKVPVELFPSGDGVLGEMHPVSRHWFCENSQPPRIKSPAAVKQFLIVSDPTESLPAAQTEGESLFRKVRANKNYKCRFFGHAMTVAQLSREIHDTDYLHLAAHYESGMTESGIRMADGLWLPPEGTASPGVVFANCCRAGLTVGDEGGLSLAGRFLKQGSRHVIAPCLPAADAVARRFAHEFYTSLLAVNDVAHAVWQARKAIGPAAWIYWHFGPSSEVQGDAAGLPRSQAIPATSSAWLRVGIILFCVALLGILGWALLSSRMNRQSEPQRVVSESTGQASPQYRTGVSPSVINVPPVQKKHPTARISSELGGDF